MTIFWNDLRKLEVSLFRQHWVKFPTEVSKIANAEFPGVYVLALTKKNVLGKRVAEEDISYVGMSNYASLRKRLRGFNRGLKTGRGHSAANRLHGRSLRGHEFYVAGVGVRCKTNKSNRSPGDLRKMGIVAAFEMFVLARVKNKQKREPELNKK